MMEFNYINPVFFEKYIVGSTYIDDEVLLYDSKWSIFGNNYDILVFGCSINGFVLTTLKILSNSYITSPSFKINVSNLIEKQVSFLDTMEVLWRSI